MPIFEPVIAGFEQAIAEAFTGKAPQPDWAGQISAEGFRNLVDDMIWTMTSEDLGNAYYGLAIVDRIVPGRFALKQPYGHDFKTPFFSRSRKSPGLRTKRRGNFGKVGPVAKTRSQRLSASPEWGILRREIGYAYPARFAKCEEKPVVYFAKCEYHGIIAGSKPPYGKPSEPAGDRRPARHQP
jgi:hypothetical protein